MPRNIDGIEEGEFIRENNQNPDQEYNAEEDSTYSTSKMNYSAKVMKWGLLILSCILNMLGLVVGPLLLRLYFVHGGSQKWLSSWLQMAGFPILFIPLAIFYLRRDQTLLRFLMVSTQVAFVKANQAMSYPIVLQVQVCVALFATISCTIGGLVNRDFSAIQREASEFDLGAKAYNLVLVSNMIAAVITFHESFTAEKGMSLALTVWGFTSYFYGSYKKMKKQTP
ncbi:hypothetical protein C5167_012116 [Papaver somniferum]|uniref:Uncharacterized protein n=1 Tax=Papaver somniferum TaxID=3469 RepID=A0A4Y7J0H3_PAPSO|nr:hypothetical protein C5167_012116 [Papaver somniferum]